MFIACIEGLDSMQRLALSLSAVEIKDFQQLTRSRLQHLLSRVGAFQIAETALDITYKNYDKLSRWCSHSGNNLVFLGDEAYPAYLSMGSLPPFCLCYRGNLPACGQPLVAISGTRQATSFACTQSYRFGYDCARHRTSIVTALSKGCEQSAHLGSLKAGYPSYGILGGGMDIRYPSCPNLMNRMVEVGGGILSPYFPWDEPSRDRLLYRNDVVSAMSPWLVVMQGGDGSGVTYCADSALRQGRDVMVHEVGLHSSASQALVDDGAFVVKTYADLVACTSMTFLQGR